MELDNRKEVNDAYRRLHQILNNVAKDIKQLRGVNSQFDTIQSKTVSVLNDKIKEVDEECKKSLEMAVWNKLVIAFFGTTNAGKSTIIETFRILFDDKRVREDGLIVGDGQSDFTKTYEEYQLRINGVPFTLIDVPGIEGNEAEYKDNIAQALRKAHIVFYIHGDANKKPDTATANKIKQYLGDGVKVYTVYNVRGSVTNYDEEEERETLLTEGVLKSEREIKKTFKDILGEKLYAGHITLQALLAMCAKAEFSPKRDDLLRYQSKLLTLFPGGAEEILRFSLFPSLVELVKERSANFHQEIAEANKHKLVKLARRIEKDITETIAKQRESIDKLQGELSSFKRDVCQNAFNSAKRDISFYVNTDIEKAYRQLKNDLFDLIDNEEDTGKIKNAAKSKQELMKRNLSRSLNFTMERQVQKLMETTERKRKKLDGVNIPSIRLSSFGDFTAHIDFDGAIENLDINFADVLNWTSKTTGSAAAGALLGGAIGSVVPVVGTAIGAAVGGALFGIAGGAVAASSSDGGKADAKDGVDGAIKQAVDIALKDVAEKLSDFFQKMDRQRHNLQSVIQSEQNNLEDFSASIDQVSSQLKSYIRYIR